METLKITVVGKDLFKIVADKLKLVDLNEIKETRSGTLGNLTTLTYFIDIPEESVIAVRKRLMGKMAEDNLRLMPMYVHGDWMRIFVFKPLVY